jgi:hypothetical protein
LNVFETDAKELILLRPEKERHLIYELVYMAGEKKVVLPLK